MAESGQVMTYDDIRKEVALLRGYRLVIDDWTDDQKELIEIIIKRGVNKFYTGASHDWSFLKPLTTLTLPASTQDFLLPSEFAYLDGGIFFTDGCQLTLEHETMLMARRQQNSTQTGRPQYICTMPVKPGTTHGPRQQLSYWPITDQAYTVLVRYSILPESLSTSRPYPYGGQAHSNTILEACLAASEQTDGELGIHTQLYEMALAGSVEHDRKVKAQMVARGSIRNANRIAYTNIVTPSAGFYGE